jgi:acetylornithine deacetylase/succinyl-diaminopimelate desuccinylase-like protein
LRDLVEELCSLERGSASAGERAAAALLRERFAEAGADSAELQGFRYSPRWTDAHAAHYAAGLVAARAGGPRGRALAAAAAVSLALEFSGRSQWVRKLLPRGHGANAVARVRPRGEPRRTVVVMAHIDAAQTGLMWHPAFTGTWAAQARRTGKAASPGTLPLLALASIAAGGRRGRICGGALLATSLALAADVARHAPVPGANDNACAAAGLVALVERFAADPLEHTELIAVATGCEESGMGGAAAFIRAARAELDPATTLVVGLDQIGAGDPHVLTGEGPPGLASYRDADLRWAGDTPRFHAAAWTDPIVAVFAGLPAISIVGVKDGGFPNYHLPSDRPDRVDWDAVDRCLALAGRIATEFDAA